MYAHFPLAPSASEAVSAEGPDGRAAGDDPWLQVRFVLPPSPAQVLRAGCSALLFPAVPRPPACGVTGGSLRAVRSSRGAGGGASPGTN